MRRISIALLAALLTGATASAQPAQKPVSIVLVHGAFVDASGWQSVFKLLTDDGYEVLVVQNPTISLQGDVEATERAIATAKYPVVLVGHSYGGMVITQAGDNPKVQRMVYLAAYAPDAGESVASLSAQPTPPGEARAPVLPPQDGYLIVDPSKFPTSFAADVDPSITRFMAASQVPWGLQARQTPITRVAWKVKQTSYLVATNDRMIPPTAQRNFAKRSGAATQTIDSSHAVMLSHPHEVASFIKTVGGSQ
jgi:pimeloyl-ACP methyl ester carboxylesterase